MSQRNTVQRQLILDSVRALNIHATAEQVFEHITRIHPSISKATVYRNMGKMAETGELLNIGNFYGSTHYDHNTHEHYHFICEDCRRVFDVDGTFSEIIERVEALGKLNIKSLQVSFSGLCSGCKK